MLLLPICNNYSTSGGLWHQCLFFLAWEIHFSCFFFNGKMLQVQRELITQNDCEEISVPAVSECISILFFPLFLVGAPGPSGFSRFQRKLRKLKMFSMTPHLDWSVLDLMRMIWNFLINPDCIFHGIPFGFDHPTVQFDLFSLALSVFQA